MHFLPVQFSDLGIFFGSTWCSAKQVSIPIPGEPETNMTILSGFKIFRLKGGTADK